MKTAITQPAVTDRVFNFLGKHPVRVVIKNEAAWFVAADLARALGFRDATNATRGLEDDERGTHIVSTPTGQQLMTIVNESGAYALVFNSRRPEAKVFRKWITAEVLPAIRQHGIYCAIRAERDKTLSLLLRDGPAEWKKTFPDTFFEAVLDLYGHQFVRSTGTPGFVGKFINRYIYEPLFTGLPAELKAKRQGRDDSAYLHQFLSEQAAEGLREQIAGVTTLLKGAGNTEAFQESFARVYHRRDQLLLTFAAKRERRHRSECGHHAA